jgi:hypothetical protein
MFRKFRITRRGNWLRQREVEPLFMKGSGAVRSMQLRFSLNMDSRGGKVELVGVVAAVPLLLYIGRGSSSTDGQIAFVMVQGVRSYSWSRLRVLRRAV